MAPGGVPYTAGVQNTPRNVIACLCEELCTYKSGFVHPVVFGEVLPTTFLITTVHQLIKMNYSHSESTSKNLVEHTDFSLKQKQAGICNKVC